MDNVLISGGTGFIGTWMRKTQPPDLRAAYLNHALYDAGMWKKYCYDYVVHLANVSPIPMLEYAQYYGSRVLYCSSGAVYEQESDYAENKRNWERECIASGIDVVIARPFTFCGFNVHKTLFDAARAGKPLEVWGDGSTVRSFMHGAEMGRLMWTILLHGERGQAYDVGSERPVTILRLAQRIKAVCNTQSEIVYIDKPVDVPVYLPKDMANTKGLLS